MTEQNKQSDTPAPAQQPIGFMDVDGLRTLVGEVRGRPAASQSSQDRMRSTFELRKRIMFAIFDPGASEGFKGDRDLTTWQTDAVMKVLREDAGLTPEEAWQELCETPDITSPEEYADHELITMEQLGSFMTRARPELYDANAFMADGEIPMTAAENVLAWMLIEKIGVVDDINYSPKQAQDIIVAAIDDASKQLVEGGEMLLKAEAVISDLTRLLQSAQEVIECASDSYKKRNGHRASFEDDSGEKCWIVPFDAFEGLRSAVAALATTEGQP